MAAGSEIMRFPGVAAAAHAGGGSVAGRIALVAIAVAAVGAFTVLQARARSGRRRSADVPGRQTSSPRDQDKGEDDDPSDEDEALFAGHGPFWGFLSVPGYRGAPQLPWTAHQPEGTQPPG
jgi:hypothetical protein